MFARQKRLQRCTSGLSGSAGMIHKLIQATRAGRVSNDSLLCARFKAPPDDWQPLSGDTEVAAVTVPAARCACFGEEKGICLPVHPAVCAVPAACRGKARAKMCFIATTFSSCCFPAWLFFLCLLIPALSLFFGLGRGRSLCVCQSLQPDPVSPLVPALCQGS